MLSPYQNIIIALERKIAAILILKTQDPETEEDENKEASGEFSTMLPNIPKIPGDTKRTWKESDVKAWLENATISQNEYYKANAGRMFDIGKSYDCIEQKILGAAFGTHVTKSNNLAIRMNHWYDRAQRILAIKIRKRMQKNAKMQEVFLDVVYVMCFMSKNQQIVVPVFYFKTFDNQIKYIDLECRVYCSWKDFLDTNSIEPSLCCYPRKGHYGQFQHTTSPTFDESIPLELEVAETRSCNYQETVKSTLKSAFTYGSMLSMATSIAFGNQKLLNIFQSQLNVKIESIKKLKNVFQLSNSAFTIANSLLTIQDKRSHDCDLKDVAAEIALMVSAVVTIIKDPFYKDIINHGIGDKKLENANFEDLSPAFKHFINLFCYARCGASLTSLITVLWTMLYKVEWSSNDYFNLASSMFNCYGVFTSPLGAKEIFEHIRAGHIAKTLHTKTADSTILDYSAETLTQHSDEATTTVYKMTKKPIIDAFNKTDFKNIAKMAGFTYDAKKLETIFFPSPSNKQENSVNQLQNEGFLKPTINVPRNPVMERNKPEGKKESDWKKSKDEVPDFLAKKRQEMTKEMMEISQCPRKGDGDEITNIIARDALAKGIIKDEKDEKGKAAFDYYQKHIIQAFKDTKNEHVINSQLVRMMYATDDIRTLFCDIESSKTTFDVKNNVLLINGQLNIDGSAFANLQKNVVTKNISEDFGRQYFVDDEDSGYEIDEKQVSVQRMLLSETKKLDDDLKAFNGDKKRLEKAQENFSETMVHLNAKSRLTFEIDIDEFEKMIKLQTGMDVKTLFESEKPFNVDDYGRFIKQFYKYNDPKIQGKLILAGIKLSKALNLTDTEGIIACHQIVYNESHLYAKNTETINDSAAVAEFLENVIELKQPEFDNFVKDTENILTTTHVSLLHRIKEKKATSFDDILLNEDPKTVATIAYAQTIEEYLLKQEITELSIDVKRYMVLENIIENINDQPMQYTLSQDGKRWIALKPKCDD